MQEEPEPHSRARADTPVLRGANPSNPYDLSTCEDEGDSATLFAWDASVSEEAGESSGSWCAEGVEAVSRRWVTESQVPLEVSGVELDVDGRAGNVRVGVALCKFGAERSSIREFCGAGDA